MRERRINEGRLSMTVSGGGERRREGSISVRCWGRETRRGEGVEEG